MKRIISGKDTGKTLQLLDYAKKENAIVVCANPTAMRKKAENYGIFGLTYTSYAKFIIQEDNRRKYVIDELELFIQRIHPNSKIIGYDLSNDED